MDLSKLACHNLQIGSDESKILEENDALIKKYQFDLSDEDYYFQHAEYKKN